MLYNNVKILKIACDQNNFHDDTFLYVNSLCRCSINICFSAFTMCAITDPQYNKVEFVLKTYLF